MLEVNSHREAVLILNLCSKVGPRFAEVNGFQFTYGQRWKQLLELYKQKSEAIERELRMEEEKLISQMEFARYEHETEMLRERKCHHVLRETNRCIEKKNLL